MHIKDSFGKYELSVDKKRRVVFEKNIGVWKAEDFVRFEQDFRNKIIPYLGSGDWAKFDDLRDYIPSTQVTPEMINNYMKWALETGFKKGAVLVASATMKMQLNRSIRDQALEIYEMKYFDDEKEANEWLEEKGF